MRYLCGSLALSLGLVALLPESAEACGRRRGSVSYGYSAPAYYAPGPYYGPGAYYPPQGGYQPLQPPTLMPPPATTVAAVSAADNKFDPPTITVAPGTTVRWTNNGTHKHTVTSATGAWDSGDLAASQVYSATFTKPGTYEYFCRHHKDMKGTVIVKVKE